MKYANRVQINNRIIILIQILIQIIIQIIILIIKYLWILISILNRTNNNNNTIYKHINNNQSMTIVRIIKYKKDAYNSNINKN
jgi:hypothetical protein